MTFMTKATVSLAALAALLVTPLAASAQDQKIRVSFGAGVNAGSIDSGTMFTGSAGYTFARNFAFDVEVSGTNKVADRFSNRVFDLGNAGNNVGGGNLNTVMGRIGDIMNGGRGGAFGGLFGGQIAAGLPNMPTVSTNTDGNTMLATVGFRFEIPTSDNRFRPYVGAGMGVSRTDETFSVQSTVASTVAGRPGTPPQTGTSALVDQSLTHTGLLGSAGAGASLRVFRQLSLDIDARYYRLDRGRNLGRFGGGVSYRF